jgi:hypothetical protein
MARKTRPNTAIVEVKFRVPRGFTAAQAKNLIWNHAIPELWLEWDEAEAMGTDVIKPRVGQARIERPKKC